MPWFSNSERSWMEKSSSMASSSQLSSHTLTSVWSSCLASHSLRIHNRNEWRRRRKFLRFCSLTFCWEFFEFVVFFKKSKVNCLFLWSHFDFLTLSEQIRNVFKSQICQNSDFEKILRRDLQELRWKLLFWLRKNWEWLSKICFVGTSVISYQLQIQPKYPKKCQNL